MSNKFITKEFSIERGTGNLSPILGEHLRLRDKQALEKNNAIYIYLGPKNVYVGQTKHFFSRHKQHVQESNHRYINGSYTKVIVAFGILINQLSLDDIEKKLITYITADYEDDRNMTVNNGTSGNESLAYQNQDEVLTDFINPFWEELFSKGYVLKKNLAAVKESILFKYSPFTSLSEEKNNIINEIIRQPQNYIVSGLAGTGKTVVLTNLAARLSQTYPNKRIAVVVKTNWVKSAQKIFQAYSVKNIDVFTAYKLIKSGEQYDYVLVDEAHRLRRYYSKGNHVTQDIFNKDGNQNELKLLGKLNPCFILFYDPAQTVRPSDIPKKDYNTFLTDNEFKKLKLTKEYRVNINELNKTYTSDDFMTGIQEFLQIDSSNAKFDHNIFQSYLTNPDAYFGVVNSIHELFDYLDDCENYEPATQNRVMAGYTREWASHQKKNRDRNDVYDWVEGNYHWKWNSDSENWLMKKNSRIEIGSIHAVQGIDLNYAGVIISTDISIDNTGKIIGIPENYKDRNGQYKSDDYSKEGFSNFIKNIYYVLLTRGIDGVRVYFEDKKMQQYFYDFMGINKEIQ